MRLTPLLLLLSPLSLMAQRPDSAVVLPPIGVTVTRTPATLQSSGASVTIVDSTLLRRARLATTLDEALEFVPGVVAQNRWNYSVDERIAIRGFGSRANFGLRGVKVLIDGVPQTLPDGQSTLNNLDLATVDHVEILRGGASALYGNASGGVIAFHTTAAPSEGWRAAAAMEGGTFGTSKEQLSIAARTGSVGATLSASRLYTAGFREQSAADMGNIAFGIDWAATGTTLFTMRTSVAHDPRARNPGALTAAEYARNPDSAAAANILRGADKSVDQDQLALGMHHAGAVWTIDATLFGMNRTLANPLATPPPAPASSIEGTWSGIDRILGGARMSVERAIGSAEIAGGIESQDVRDQRINKRSVGGVPTDTILVDQTEKVAEFGVFAQITLPAGKHFAVRAGARRDINAFEVADHFLGDGDASANRSMNSNDADAGISWKPSAHVIAYSNVATVFETPTTTELANRPDGSGGFNPDLGPQRSVTEELGLRTTRGAFDVDVAAYHTTTRDAIVAYSEVAGRSYFRNVGATRTAGAEAAIVWRPVPHWAIRGTWTLTDAVFTDYLIVGPTSTDTLNGNHLAGIPRQVAHVGVQGSLGALLLDIDQSWSAAMFGDDDNRITVAGWGAGVTNARLSWHGTIAHWSAAPFVVFNNLFDRSYVGSVTINGAGGRVLEPAGRRGIYAGVSLGVQSRLPAAP